MSRTRYEIVGLYKTNYSWVAQVRIVIDDKPGPPYRIVKYEENGEVGKWEYPPSQFTCMKPDPMECRILDEAIAKLRGE